MLGQRARFERYAADLLFMIAAGQKIDTDRTPRFSEIVDGIYRNPFEKKEEKKLKTAAEIKQHIVGRIEGLLEEMHYGSDDAGSEDNAG